MLRRTAIATREAAICSDWTPRTPTWGTRTGEDMDKTPMEEEGMSDTEAEVKFDSQDNWGDHTTSLRCSCTRKKVQWMTLLRGR